MQRSAALLARCTAIAALLLVPMMPATVVARQGENTWTVPGDFATIQEAIDSEDVLSGDTIQVGPGVFAGANVTKAIHIDGRGRTTIDSGPPAGDPGDFGFYVTANGAAFTHLTFDVALGVYGNPADDVTIEHCRFIDNFQAITNWGGSNWRVRYNTIQNVVTLGIDSGVGGTPIVIGARTGAVAAQNNVVSHNKVTGDVLFDPSDDGTEGDIWAIIVAAFPEAAAVSGNLIAHNQVTLSTSKPEVREVVGLWLLDATSGGCDVVYENLITKNHFRGPDRTIDVVPDLLQDCNSIVKNK